MEKDIEKVLINAEEIDKLATNLGKQISQDYHGKRLLVICLLKGSIIFTADLLRKISISCEIDFMQASSYGDGTSSSREPKVLKDISYPLNDYDILIVEDIIDSGFTLDYVIRYLKSRNAKSVNVCTLLSKPSRREVDVYVKYIGKIIDDYFVVGYGLDFAEKYRNLPYIGVLKSEAYQK